MTARAITPLAWPPDTTVVVPGSKSFTNRALITAALASGRSTLRGVLFSDDTEAMLSCLQSLGIPTIVDRANFLVTVDGCGGTLPTAAASVNVRQSGTTARFMAPMLALGRGRYQVDGDAQMRARPMGDLVQALKDLGVRVEGSGSVDRLPLTVTSDGVRGGEISVPGDVSSQFLSGLLLSAPCFVNGLTVRVVGDLVSKPYVDMTLSTMAAFGARIARDSYESFAVAPGGYRSADYVIEPDASAASYFFGAAAIMGGRVRIEGLGTGALQGDVAFVDILESMGATVVRTASTIEVDARSLPPGGLRGVDVDMAHCSDTAQTLAAVAVFASSPTKVTGIGFIRRKETDRINAVVTELRRCGIQAREDTDGFTIFPGTPQPATFATYDDHRMAMSFSLLGLKVPGMAVENPGCVAKTFPRFFDVLEALRHG